MELRQAHSTQRLHLNEAHPRLRCNLNTALKFLILAVAAVQVTAAMAQQTSGNLNVHLHPRTLSVQAKAEELFERGNYRRAYTIYLNDLAPIGDKYAQYMLGYMCLGGLGVDQDTVLASAWYRLAAERGSPEEFVRIRDELLGKLDAVDRAHSDQFYLGLRREYSDIAISMREAIEEFENLPGASTGSLLGDASSAVTIVEPSATDDALAHRAQLRLQGHLDRITTTLGKERIDARNVTAADLDDLEASVSDFLR